MSNRTHRVPALRRIRSSLKKSLLAAALVSGTFASGNAAAIFGIGDIVIDPAHIAETVRKIKQDYDHYKSVVDHYRQQLISLGGMSVTPTSMNDPNGDFPRINDPDYGVQHACRANSDGVIGTVKTLFQPSANKDILEQQLDICRRIVRAENLKYNVTVDYLNNLRRRQRELNTLDSRRGSVGKEQGKLQAVAYDVQRFQQASKMDMDNWQAMILAYDSYIGQLNKYQQRLAQRALRGQQPDILTTVVQGKVLQDVLDKKKNQD